MILSYQDERQRGSVSERHAARLDALEPIVERMLANEAKLIADSVVHERAIAALSDAMLSFNADREQAERELRDRDVTLGLLPPLPQCGLLGRLRWLLTGTVGL